MATFEGNSCCKTFCVNTQREWSYWFRLITTSRCNFAKVFAILCFLIIIIGNTLLLLGVNFWLDLIIKETTGKFTPVAVQVIANAFLVICFLVLTAVYIAVYGVQPLIRAAVDRNRMGGPLYRFLLMVASGATNGISSTLGIYAITYTPEFMQAVLLSVIPFFAQVWTYLLVKEERDRNYRSFTLIASLVLCVTGVLLASLSSFFTTDVSTKKAPWGWAFVYFVSCIVFGLWCVVQRLYFDAIIIRKTRGKRQKREPQFTPSENKHDVSHSGNNGAGNDKERVTEMNPTGAHGALDVDVVRQNPPNDDDENPMKNRQWAKQDQNELAAKVLILLVGIFFQTLTSIAFVPVDAIPGFGTSNGLHDSWKNFSGTFYVVFQSWANLRFGILHTLGFLMSFIGCAYLNERSPPLASVVLQLAGPVTSIVLVIVPQWDVFGEHGIWSHKVGGVVMLLVAGWAYHVWEVAYPSAYAVVVTPLGSPRSALNI